jgi:uncharacterized membrane protein
MATTTEPRPDYAAASATTTSNGKSTAALVFGILSLPLAVLFFPIGFLMGLVAVILGVMGRRETAGSNGRATAGLVLGIVGLALSIIIVAFVGSFMAKHGKDMKACSQQSTPAARQACIQQRFNQNP